VGKPKVSTRIARWVAWHLPPKVAYFCALRLEDYAIENTHGRGVSGPALPVCEMLELWREKYDRALRRIKGLSE